MQSGQMYARSTVLPATPLGFLKPQKWQIGSVDSTKTIVAPQFDLGDG
jgi:hypothetical protein